MAFEHAFSERLPQFGATLEQNAERCPGCLHEILSLRRFRRELSCCEFQLELAQLADCRPADAERYSDGMRF